MDHKKTAEELLKHVGGSENIESASHCVTRLRLSIKDMSRVNDQAIKTLKDVNGTVNQGGQYQIVIGPKVEQVYKEFEIAASKDQAVSPSNEVKNSETPKKKNVFSRMIDVLMSCFIPIIPVIAGSGMIKVLCTILVSAGVLTNESSTLQILSLMGDGVFYFLPFFVAFTAAKKFNTDHFAAMVMAAILLHPNLMAMSAEGATSTSFIGIPLQLLSYSSQAVPIILAVWLMSYVNPIADRLSPAMVKVFLRPMLTILIVAPVMLIVFGPLGDFLGGYFGKFVDVMNTWGWIAVSINALIFPFLVITGTHNALIPLIITMFATKGFDPVLIVSGLVVNIAQAGAAFAVALKTKNNQMKGIGLSAGVASLFGITEPALYGVNLRLKRPFIAVLIGSTLAGAVAGITGVTAYSFVSPSIISLPIFIGDEGFISLVWVILSVITSFVLTFIFVWLLGFKDPVDEEKESKQTVTHTLESKDMNDSPVENVVEEHVASPLKGEVIRLSQVNDEAFATESMGKGFAIIPSEGKVVAPFDGIVVVISKTKHAVALVSDNGMELLIHVGIDTVKLKGNHFNLAVQVGDQVQKGDTLMVFDKEEIKNLGYDLTTSIVVTNSDRYPNIQLKTGNVTYGDHVLNT
ncbi:PTS system beta-glucosides-specific IIC component [Paenibacillus amylolyticus]|uniref:PTS system beta-glucosides-specific IIC component n=1 Tax=Paenibacillus amylolyticus TaxID=1451 RepID=A0AAP5H5W0_PAEAM|nr:beta-glucoside-specific PTS transporter subunit IIABC [Paenibacillus amylolyticus]MDR6724516.1 PTS system beta-glucosides-specific IIC component [Paenibacillus amylolyticus]